MVQGRHPFFEGLETFLKLVTPIGAVIAFLVGIYHYKDTKTQEFKKEFWLKRYELYQEVNDLTSEIANTTDSIRYDSLSREFWTLYWGKSILLEDKHVFHAMQSFGTSLKKEIEPDSMKALQNKSMLLGHACRLSLKETWEPIPIKELEEMDN